jgi:hypothetical protein
MKIAKIATVVAVVLGMFAVSANQSDADAHGRKYGKKHSHYGYGVKPQVRGYVARGYGYDYAFQRPLYEGLYAGRNYSTDLTFWERVNSDPRTNSNEVGVSGF